MSYSERCCLFGFGWIQQELINFKSEYKRQHVFKLCFTHHSSFSIVKTRARPSNRKEQSAGIGSIYTVGGIGLAVNPLHSGFVASITDSLIPVPETETRAVQCQKKKRNQMKRATQVITTPRNNAHVVKTNNVNPAGLAPGWVKKNERLSPLAHSFTDSFCVLFRVILFFLQKFLSMPLFPFVGLILNTSLLLHTFRRSVCLV